MTRVDTYIVGQSTWVTGEHSESELAKKVGLIVNGTDLGSAPISQAEPGHFKYWKNDLKETDVVQVYLATEEGKELTKAAVPIVLPKQNLTIFINGEEQTGDFEVKQIDQDEYVALSEKSPDIVYAVQPNDPESGLVYFLDDVPVDLVKNTAGVLYNRNLLVGATSEWKDFSITGWTTETHRKEISEYGLSIGDTLIQSIELDNTNSENQGGIRSFIVQYDETDTQIDTASGETIAVGETGTSTATLAVAGNAIEVAISIGHSINDHTDTGRFRKRKIANGTNGDSGNFTIAPEDIINQ
ncbi:immunoglobulin-like domain-containing protein [Enterococcus sp. DIV0213j]|uniref:immunoglobulin-like domain-containing protein n=1 Tax=Enterococcus sp. DIV0213j TaxID=2774649 RepID=UPI003D2AB8B3